MQKYIINVPDDMIVSRELPTLAIKARFGNMRQFALDTGLKLTPYDDDAERRSAEKAWELARWCFKDASDSDLERAFPFEWNHGGYRRIADMPYIQAAGRYETWQKQSKEDDGIKVGDEVKFFCESEDRPPIIMVVTKVYWEAGKIHIDGMNAKGEQYAGKLYTNWLKTGRYFPEVTKLLGRMREES